jgi:transposase
LLLIFFLESIICKINIREEEISNKGKISVTNRETISKKPITQGAKISLPSKTQILTHRIFQKNSQSHQTNSQTQSQNNYTHKNQHESKPETENNSETRSKSEREKVETFCFFFL